MSVVLVLNRERHAAAMTRWAVHLTRVQGGDLYIVVAKGGAEAFAAVQPGKSERSSSVWEEAEGALLDLGLVPDRPGYEEAAPSDLPVRFLELAHETRAAAVLAYLAETKASLLVVGRQLSARSEQAEEGRFARALFDSAPCRTMLLRLGNHDGGQCQSILAPTRDGPHGRVALQLGHRLAGASGGVMTLAIVEPTVGEDGRALGEAVLHRALQNAKVGRDDPHVKCKVILANNTAEALAVEAEARNHDLLLLGESSSAGLRKRLFGTVPGKLLSRPGGMAVGVVREAPPASQVLRSRLESWWRERLPPLEREQRLKVFERLQLGSALSVDFLVLISLSTFIAALGLIQSSPAVVIGAMLVAPLMTPLLGAGLGLVQGNVPMIRTCFFSIFAGFLLAFGIGFLTGLGTVPELTPELESRCRPGLLDLGVAFVSGMAASYCLVRPGLSSALAGVAIAAALVPPIATSGIVLTYEGWAFSGSAALLFGTNVVAIILGSALIFFLVGIRGSKSERSAIWVRRILLVLLLAIVALQGYFLTQSSSFH